MLKPVTQCQLLRCIIPPSNQFNGMELESLQVHSQIAMMQKNARKKLLVCIGAFVLKAFTKPKYKANQSSYESINHVPHFQLI